MTSDIGFGFFHLMVILSLFHDMQVMETGISATAKHAEGHVNLT